MTAHTWVRRILTGLASALMVLSALPDVLSAAGAVTVFHHLGYPAYLLPFLGTAKLLGVATVLAPGFRRLKEWAYAGLTFDLLGALYSHLSVGDPVNVWAPAAIGLSLVAASYVAHRNRLDGTTGRSLRSVMRGSSSDQVAASVRLG